MRLLLLLLAFVAFIACSKRVEHDEIAAAKRAVEFAELAFVEQDIAKAYALLSDAARRHVPLAKFKETLARLNPGARASSVTATGYEPMPGENAIYIYISVDASGEAYTVTVEGTAATAYRVSTITAGTGARFHSGQGKKAFSRPVGAP